MLNYAAIRCSNTTLFERNAMEKYSAIGSMLVFLFATFGSTSCIGTTTPTQVSPQEPLVAVTKSNVREFWTNAFGRKKRSGGYSVIVPVERAEQLLEWIRGQMPSGYIAFIGTTNNLDDPKINGAEIVMAPPACQLGLQAAHQSAATEQRTGFTQLGPMSGLHPATADGHQFGRNKLAAGDSPHRVQISASGLTTNSRLLLVY